MFRLQLAVICGLGWFISPTLGQPPVKIAGRTIDQFVDQLSDPNRTVRLRAAHSLGAFGKAAGVALCDGLQHDDPAVRYLMAIHLGRIGGPALNHAIERLNEMAGQPTSTSVQMAAAFALCRAQQADHHLATLLAATDDPRRGIACTAIDLIGQLGSVLDDDTLASAIEKLTQIAANNRAGGRRGDYHLGNASKNALRVIRAENSSGIEP